MSAKLRMARSRLQAQLTGGKESRDIGLEEAHARTVLAITRKIHKGEARARVLSKELKTIRVELRRDRRELRIILQRDPNATRVSLEAAGPPDAIDASEHRREHVSNETGRKP
jgi:hypothetical protein